MVGRGVVRVRSRGLWAGVDIDPGLGTGRDVCEALARRRVLTGTRMAPRSGGSASCDQ